MSDSELVELVDTCEAWGNKPFTTAPELSEKVGMSRWGVQKRLEALVENGEIRKYKPGQAAIYWTEDGAEG
jgi:response regulator of citrate/malate metabolism